MASAVEARRDDALVVICLDTLEYLKKGGRISGPQAAIGSLLGVKPIISIKDGLVDTVDRVRTRSKARERAIEFILAEPVERIAVLHTVSPDVEAFREEMIRRAPGGIDPGRVSISLVGPSVGPHLGPGAVGAAVLGAAADRRLQPRAGRHPSASSSAGRHTREPTAPPGTGTAMGRTAYGRVRNRPATWAQPDRDIASGPPIYSGASNHASRVPVGAGAPWGRPGDDSGSGRARPGGRDGGTTHR